MAKRGEAKSAYPWLKSYPEEIQWDAKIPHGLVFDMLKDTASKYPRRTAIYFLGKKYTYHELYQLVKQAAKGLQELGVKRGTRVGLFMPNAPSYVVFYYAILKAGGTVVNYSPLYAPRELEFQINNSETEIMVTLDLTALYPKVQEMLLKTSLRKIIVCPLKDQLPFPKNYLFSLLKSKEVSKIDWDERHVDFKDLINNDGAVKQIELNALEDIALIQYTGGTTGIPKGAMLTHANVYANTHQAELWFLRPKGSQEKILAALPLFHVFAMTAVMNLAILQGAEIVMMFPRFNVDDALKMIQKHRITFFPAVPTIYTLICEHPGVRKFNLSSLIACLSGGAPLPGEVKRRFEDLTGCKLVEAYGLSETSPAATSNPLFGLNKTGSIGIPFPGTIVKIMSLEDSDKEMPLGEKGEICIKGPQVMKGYWNSPEETSNVLENGLFHTGDVGYMDEDGYTFLVDRIKDLILSSGFNVYPRNIEEAIYLHPQVVECTVIGVPDKKRGEVAKAFIKLKPESTLTEEEILGFLKDKVSAVEMPKHIEFRDQLPKTIIGKLSKKELIEEEKSKHAEDAKKKT
jgi:long-chain acyl-CoA synthetase